jgi:iron complex transport system ATP-binding protein
VGKKTMNALLNLKNVSAGYGGGDIIKNIDLRVGPHENLGIIGPNGCGKTTLLKVIANLLPFTGEAEIEGKPYRRIKRREMALQVAMLGQSAEVYFTYSVYDTVMMGRYPHIRARLSGSPNAEDRAQVAECLKTVELTAEQDRPITTLSGGQLQRVFLARTLVQQPKLILLDEPTNHLDLKYQLELVEYLKKWAAEGDRAVIGVLHDINLAIHLGDTWMVMKGGKVQTINDVETIIRSGMLDTVFETGVTRYMRDNLKRWV